MLNIYKEFGDLSYNKLYIEILKKVNQSYKVFTFKKNSSLCYLNNIT